jgi:hypothetical protein
VFGKGQDRATWASPIVDVVDTFGAGRAAEQQRDINNVTSKGGNASAQPLLKGMEEDHEVD